MKKIIFLGVFILFVNSNLYSQISFCISQINASVKVNYVEGDFDSDDDDGPSLSLKLMFENKGKDTLYLHPRKADVLLFFSYKGVSYNTSQRGLHNVIDEDLLVIKPNESKTFLLFTNILMGTNLIHEDKKDFLNILFCILPTLSISYEELGIAVRTNEIREVNLNTY